MRHRPPGFSHPSLLALAVPALLLGLGACGASDDTPVGAVRITVTTEGGLPDPDGYAVVIEGRDPAQIGPNGELMIADLAVGEYSALLKGLAQNCWVSSTNPLTVQVEANVVAIAAFVVSCPATGGRVRVVTSTSGPDPDGDGYLISIGGSPLQAIPANGSFLVGSNALGIQSISVQGVAPHCTPSPGNPTTVEVLQATSVEVALSFACASISGAIKVSLVATGVDIRADGLSVTVNSITYPIAVGAPVTIARLLPATYNVDLVGVLAGNCALEGGTRRQVVIATLADTAEVTFTVSCTEAPVVRITAVTTGVAPDTNGYEVTLYQYSYWYAGFDTTFTSPSNGTTEVRTLPSGYYYVGVGGVSPNCTIRQQPPSFDLAAADVAISFAVECDPLRQLAYTARGGSTSDIHVFTTDGTTLVLSAAGADSNPDWSPSGTELVFTTDRDGNPEIYRMNADGSGATRLTNSAGADYRPAWSPDGSRIAFVSERDGNPEIYVMSRDGTGLVRLTTSPGTDTDPAWSPDGTRLVFSSTREGTLLQLYVMDANGSNVQRRTTSPFNDRTPAWSPDGSLIAFSRGSGESAYPFVMSATGLLPRALGQVYSILPVSPDWSADGLKVAFSYAACDFYYGCGTSLFVYDVPRDELSILPIGDPDISDPSWRP